MMQWWDSLNSSKSAEGVISWTEARPASMIPINTTSSFLFAWALCLALSPRMGAMRRSSGMAFLIAAEDGWGMGLGTGLAQCFKEEARRNSVLSRSSDMTYNLGGQPEQRLENFQQYVTMRTKRHTVLYSCRLKDISKRGNKWSLITFMVPIFQMTSSTLLSLPSSSCSCTTDTKFLLSFKILYTISKWTLWLCSMSLQTQ